MGGAFTCQLSQVSHYIQVELDTMHCGQLQSQSGQHRIVIKAIKIFLLRLESCKDSRTQEQENYVSKAPHFLLLD